MNKKMRISLIIILIIALISFSIFVYFENYYIAKGYAYDFTKSEIKEEIKGEMKKVSDEKLGFSFEVPNDWEVIKNEEGLLMESPDINFREAIDFPTWKQGCRIVLIYQRTDRNPEKWVTPYDSTLERMETLKKHENNEYSSGGTTESIVQLFNMDAMKTVEEFRDSGREGILPMSITTIRLPAKNDVLYLFETMELLDREPVCEPIFDQFLSSLEIRDK